MTDGERFVEIKIEHKKRSRTFRFYGLGVWTVMVGEGWHPINAANVPAQALSIAAGEWQPTPPSATDLFGM